MSDNDKIRSALLKVINLALIYALEHMEHFKEWSLEYMRREWNDEKD